MPVTKSVLPCIIKACEHSSSLLTRPSGKECLRELQSEPDQNPVRSSLGISRQHDSDVSKAEPQEGCRPRAGRGKQEEEEDGKDPKLAEFKRLPRGAKCRTNLVFQAVSRHTSIRSPLTA